MEGVASAEDIDAVAKLGFNHPMGPLALADLIGNDTVLAIMEVLYKEFGDPEIPSVPAAPQDGRSWLSGTQDRQRILRLQEMMGGEQDV